jgi:hypothetical protein
MLTKHDLVTLLVAWSSMNDAGLAEEDGCLSIEVCSPEDRPAVRRAARLIDHLRKRFSYLESPIFRRELQGKSEAVATMRTRLEDEPTKRVAHLQAFTSALRSILSSRDVYDLVPIERHAELDALASILEQVANPDEGQRAL